MEPPSFVFKPPDESLKTTTKRPSWASRYPNAFMKVDEEAGHNEILYADKKDAARVFHSQLSVEANEGCIERWKGRSHFQSDQGDLFYECWLDGDYLSNHYEIRVEEKQIILPHNWEAFCRGVDANQYVRLLTVLTDNGVEADEAGVVAEAIGFVLDVDMSKASEE